MRSRSSLRTRYQEAISTDLLPKWWPQDVNGHRNEIAWQRCGFAGGLNQLGFSVVCTKYSVLTYFRWGGRDKRGGPGIDPRWHAGGRFLGPLAIYCVRY